MCSPREGQTSRAASEIFWRCSKRLAQESPRYSYAGMVISASSLCSLLALRKNRSEPTQGSDVDSLLQYGVLVELAWAVLRPVSCHAAAVRAGRECLGRAGRGRAGVAIFERAVHM